MKWKIIKTNGHFEIKERDGWFGWCEPLLYRVNRYYNFEEAEAVVEQLRDAYCRLKESYTPTITIKMYKEKESPN